MRFGITKKFLFAFLTLSLLPLVALSIYARQKVVLVGEAVFSTTREELVKNASSLLEARARAIAQQVELFLQGSADDLRTLSHLPTDAAVYAGFYRSHQRTVWIRIRDNGSAQEIRLPIPLYRELTWVDAAGIERIRVFDGNVYNTRRDLSRPIRGLWGQENYFNRSRALPRGELYVSRLLGRHVRAEEQLQGADGVETAVGGDGYNGIIRFAMPVYRGAVLTGVVSLALDHQHLMEYTQHVLPLGNREVVFPSYSSGNYAFLFDDEGWIITHPKFWDIRGYDRDTGSLVDPTGSDYTEAAMKAGRVPFNLFHVPFIHINYRHVAEEVLAGRSGVTQTASVGGVSRVLAFAPIAFDHGEYRQSGFFGGVTLGAQTDIFHNTVNQSAERLSSGLARTVRHFAVIIVIAGGIVALAAVFLARSFTRPILILTEKIKEISQGRFDFSVNIHSGDELEILARRFEKMGRELKQKQGALIRSMKDLEASKNEIETYSLRLQEQVDFIERIFANMLSGLLVVDHDGTVRSANIRAGEILGIPVSDRLGAPVNAVLKDFPDLLNQISVAVASGETAHAEFQTTTTAGRQIYLETAVSALSDPSETERRSVLLIFRDISRRKQMEQHLNRSDRLVSLGTLAAGIAHEIRNPLTGISLLLDDLHDRMANRTDERLMMQSALEEIEKLEKIVNELLQFAAKPTSHLAPKDLDKVIDTSLFFVHKQCAKQRVALDRSRADHLPPVKLDPEKIKQAVLNILLNALNVVGEGGRISITTRLTSPLDIMDGKPSVELIIADDGPGIDPGDLKYVFDPFFTRNPHGSGLGLSITHAIIEEHQGKIVAESEPGAGATFRIYFPPADDKE
jgi:PAS domain S-box-containing protein